MGYSGLDQERVVAQPCNLVNILQIGVQKDMPNNRSVLVPEEELCQPVVWMTKTEMIPPQAGLAQGR
eukprot:18985-Pleurochrysis_carterae.AAC.1